MFIPSWQPATLKSSSPTYSKSVEQLKEEVHHLTQQTDRLRDESTAALALTTTAGLATLAGGALSFLPATRSVGLTVASIAGLCLAGGIGVAVQTNGKLAQSEAERLAVAGELFDTRRLVSREKMRKLFAGG